MIYTIVNNTQCFIVAALIQKDDDLSRFKSHKSRDNAMPSRNPYSLTGVDLSALLVVSLILVYVT